MIFFRGLFSKNKIELKVNDGGRTAAGFKGKTGDCVVRSIAIATNLPYKKYIEIFIKLMKILE